VTGNGVGLLSGGTASGPSRATTVGNKRQKHVNFGWFFFTGNGVRLSVSYQDSCPGDDWQAEPCNNGKKTRDGSMRFLAVCDW
jgi:hypothetical protein